MGRSRCPLPRTGLPLGEHGCRFPPGFLFESLDDLGGRPSKWLEDFAPSSSVGAGLRQIDYFENFRSNSFHLRSSEPASGDEDPGLLWAPGYDGKVRRKEDFSYCSHEPGCLGLAGEETGILLVKEDA